MTETGDHKKPMSNADTDSKAGTGSKAGSDSKSGAGDAGDPCGDTRTSAGLPRMEPETFTGGQSASGDQRTAHRESIAVDRHREEQQASAPQSADAAPKDAAATSSVDAADADSATGNNPSAGESSTVSSEAGSADTASAPAGGSIDTQDLHDRIVDQMKTVYDPEIPVDIYELGMIYEIDVESDGRTHVTMTLTSPACPVAGTLPGEVEEKLNEVEGVKDGKVELVWDPPWSPDLMSESAKLELGMM